MTSVVFQTALHFYNQQINSLPFSKDSDEMINDNRRNFSPFSKHSDIIIKEIFHHSAKIQILQQKKFFTIQQTFRYNNKRNFSPFSKDSDITTEEISLIASIV